MSIHLVYSASLFLYTIELEFDNWILVPQCAPHHRIHRENLYAWVKYFSFCSSGSLIRRVLRLFVHVVGHVNNKIHVVYTRTVEIGFNRSRFEFYGVRHNALPLRPATILNIEVQKCYISAKSSDMEATQDATATQQQIVLICVGLVG